MLSFLIGAISIGIAFLVMSTRENVFIIGIKFQVSSCGSVVFVVITTYIGSGRPEKSLEYDEEGCQPDVDRRYGTV